MQTINKQNNLTTHTTMLKLNFLSAALFTPLCLLALIGGFYNPFHFATAAMCAVLIVLFLRDKDYSDESAWDYIERYYNAKRK